MSSLLLGIQTTKETSMARNILILGASYGSLLGTKLLMAGHNVTLVCRKKTAELINRDGTEVRIKLRDEAVHRAIFSRNLPGKLDATEPQTVDISRYDLVALAMQEPQYTNHTVRVLMVKIAAAGLPCLSIMNMPPLPYLQRIPSLRGDGPRRGLHQRARLGALQAGPGDALLARSAGVPSAGRGGERAACGPAHQFQGLGVRGREAQRAAARAGSRYRRRHARRQGRAGEAEGVRLAVRAIGKVVDAADRQLPLHHAERSAVDPRRRARRSRSSRRRSTTTSMPSRENSAPIRPTRCRSPNTPRRRRAC